MFNQKPNGRSAAAVAAAVGGARHGSASTNPSQEVIEARQESQIWTTYALNHYLRANDLKVSVREGNATLRGNVAESASKELARQIALDVDGIKSVDNQIEVMSNYISPLPSTERSYAELVDDASITSAVNSKLMWSRHADGLAAKVEAARGKVNLSGTATSAEAKDAAGKFASNTRGVNSVDNQIRVESAKPGAANEAGGDMTDAWITLKVKSTFQFSSNVESSDIAVSTHDGIVKLVGRMESNLKRELAIELARDVRGVKSVDSNSLML